MASTIGHLSSLSACKSICFTSVLPQQPHFKKPCPSNSESAFTARLREIKCPIDMSEGPKKVENLSPQIDSLFMSLVEFLAL